MLKGILDALFPQFCFQCGDPVQAPFESICLRCAERELPLACAGEVLCRQCGLPLYQASDDLCFECYSGRTVKNQSLYSYLQNPLIRELLHRFKFERKKTAAADLSQIIREQLHLNLEKYCGWTVVPVPVSSVTLKQRGYNQIEVMLKLTGVPYQNLLTRKEAVAAQKELSRSERRAGLLGQYQCLPGVIVPKRVIFVDDVFTTGSTATAVERALLEGGAEKIECLTILREE